MVGHEEEVQDVGHEEDEDGSGSPPDERVAEEVDDLARFGHVVGPVQHTTDVQRPGVPGEEKQTQSQYIDSGDKLRNTVPYRSPRVSSRETRVGVVHGLVDAQNILNHGRGLLIWQKLVRNGRLKIMQMGAVRGASTMLVPLRVDKNSRDIQSLPGPELRRMTK